MGRRYRINEGWEDWKESYLVPRGSVADDQTWDYPVDDGYEEENLKKKGKVERYRGSSATSVNTDYTRLPSNDWEKKHTFKNGQTVLDLGGGQYDNVVHHLKDTYGITTLVYDPFAQSGGVVKIKVGDKVVDSQPAVRGPEVMKKVKETIEELGGVDVVMCNNVLNVIPSRSAIENTIQQAAEALNDNGVAYFKIYAGDESHKGGYRTNFNKAAKKSERVFQQNKAANVYVPLIEKYFNEVKLQSKFIIARGPIAQENPAIWAYDANFDPNDPSKRLNKRIHENRVRLTESQLYGVIRNTVGNILTEVYKEIGKGKNAERYMHVTQAVKEIPSDIYQTALSYLKRDYPDFEFNSVMWAPGKGIVRFDYSGDFDTCSEPVLDEYVRVFYNEGRTKKDTSKAVWHGVSDYWVDDDYNDFRIPKEKTRAWRKKYKQVIDDKYQAIPVEQRPKKYPLPNGGSRAAWMHHLIELGLIDDYFEVNGIEDPMAYLGDLDSLNKKSACKYKHLQDEYQQYKQQG